MRDAVPATVLVADDHATVSAALCAWLRDLGGVRVESPVRSLDELCARLRIRSPNVILLDLHLARESPGVVVAVARACAPRVALIGISALVPAPELLAVLDAFVPKDELAEKLPDVLRRVSAIRHVPRARIAATAEDGDLFVRESLEALVKLEGAWTGRDPEAVGTLAHHVQGGADVIGAEAVAELARGVARAAAAEAWADVPALLPRLRAALREWAEAWR